MGANPQNLGNASFDLAFEARVGEYLGSCDVGIHNVVVTARMNVRSPDLGTHGTRSLQFENAGDFYCVRLTHPLMTEEPASRPESILGD